MTLLETVLAILLCLLVTAAARWPASFAVGATCLLITLAWSRACLRAPELTRNATVILVLGFLAAAVVPGRLVSMREDARRQQATNALRQLGQARQAELDVRPERDLTGFDQSTPAQDLPRDARAIAVEQSPKLSDRWRF